MTCVNWRRSSSRIKFVVDMTPYIPTPDQTADLTGGGRSIFLAAFNPNYTAQYIAASLALRW